MSTIVEIIIKGVAICYKKGDNWHVLFPIDAEGCHSIKFSCRKVDEEANTEYGSLARPGTSIAVMASKAAFASDEADDFNKHVLDLTSKIYPVTHQKIRKKGDITGKAVLMTISNASFSVHKYLQNFPEVPIPDLEEVGTQNKTPIRCKLTAHSVKAKIVLRPGGQVTVASSALADDFVTEVGSSYILCFDNDCKDPKPDRNDMDMFYDIIEDVEKPDRKFRIGKVGPKNDKREFLVEPPDPEKGKPCLVVKVTDPNDLP